MTFAVYEHDLLKPGVVLEIRVGGLGEIGKYTKFVIRRGRFPARTDACLDPASSKPVSC